MRVVIADDSALLREGLQLIFTEAGHDVVAAVSDGTELRAAALEHRADLHVVDVRMPPSHTDEGMRAALDIRKEWPDSKIMMLSQYIEVSYATELLAGGAGGTGYLLKDRVTRIESFLTSAADVAAGGTALDPQVVSGLMSARKDPLSVLTDRERELLALMAEGKSNVAIAEAMFVTLGTVEKHSQRVFTKLGLEQDHGENRRVMAVLTYLGL